MEAREVKVVLLGEAGVGKSSLVLRFVTGSFDKYSEATIGASFMSKLINVDGAPIKYQIWDTAGACAAWALGMGACWRGCLGAPRRGGQGEWGRAAGLLLRGARHMRLPLGPGAHAWRHQRSAMSPFSPSCAARHYGPLTLNTFSPNTRGPCLCLSPPTSALGPRARKVPQPGAHVLPRRCGGHYCV